MCTVLLAGGKLTATWCAVCSPWPQQVGGCGGNTIDLGDGVTNGNEIYCINAARLSLPECDSYSDFDGEVAAVQKICAALSDCVGFYDYLDDGNGLRLCGSGINTNVGHRVWTKPLGRLSPLVSLTLCRATHLFIFVISSALRSCQPVWYTCALAGVQLRAGLLVCLLDCLMHVHADPCSTPVYLMLYYCCCVADSDPRTLDILCIHLIVVTSCIISLH